jgi:pyruvate dehydrogenase E2 component (dihydrolipoamide acetyltransferase)
MKKTILFPKLSESITEGIILKVHKKVGDSVKKDELIAEISTDKIDNEIHSEWNGVITAIFVKKDDEIKVGAPLLELDLSEMALQTVDNQPFVATQNRSVSETMLHQAFTEKENRGVSETALQMVNKQSFAAKQTIGVSEMALQSIDNQVFTEKQSAGKRITPLARTTARALNIDVSTIDTSAERILQKDILAKVRAMMEATPPILTGFKPKKLPDFTKFGVVRNEKMTHLNKAVAENMQISWSTIPHAWITEKADMSKIEALREQFKIKTATDTRRMTTTIFITKAVARVLRQPEFALFNASLDIENQEIIFKQFINIGIAVDTERGLYVPVIRDCDRKGLQEISMELTAVATRVRDKKHSSDDLQGGTFTISNVGSIGGTHLFPIVNAPEVAILGVTATQIEAIWNPTKATFEPRPILPLTIGFDHRIINGAAATRFLVAVKQLLEEPFLMQMM